jgi:hypothetical protein
MYKHGKEKEHEIVLPLTGHRTFSVGAHRAEEASKIALLTKTMLREITVPLKTYDFNVSFAALFDRVRQEAYSRVLNPDHVHQTSPSAPNNSFR